jgi:hypothetical protein
MRWVYVICRKLIIERERVWTLIPLAQALTYLLQLLGVVASSEKTFQQIRARHRDRKHSAAMPA